ncbi:MAG: DEAD/DEAH box helicase, partial [Coriobacteriales bacterium]|nr:DEAD/DEAH box helicase [Coriobacteriales bacterium]
MPQPIRLQHTQALDEPVESLRFVSSGRALALERLGIGNKRDLLEHYPRRYLDLSTVSSIQAAKIGETVTIVGRVGEVKLKKPKPRMTIVECSVIDSTGVIIGVWFKQPWIANRLKKGDRVSMSGKVEMNFGFKRMNSPFYEVLEAADRDPDSDDAYQGRVIAFHPLCEGINAAWMRRFVHEALEDCRYAIDPLPAQLRVSRGLVDRNAAWRGMHEPADMREQEEARRRLAYDELILLQLHFLLGRRQLEAGLEPQSQVIDGPLLSMAREQLPFTLTDEQEKALEQILADMAAPRIMERLLLGDVGTGKTVVAALAMIAAVDSGQQCAMMAPTAVLAGQYGNKIGPMLESVGIEWALLTSATPAATRDRILERLASGQLKVLMGTHALIQDDVVFSNLGLVAVDEQHRFGVDQRTKLRRKGKGSDYLAMTATPIPRSLALLLYGDLDCSTIHRRPGNSTPCKTVVLSSSERAVAYDAIREAVKLGRQAYIICPLVGVKSEQEEDEQGLLEARIEQGEDCSDPKAAQTEARFLASK